MTEGAQHGGQLTFKGYAPSYRNQQILGFRTYCLE